MAEHASQRIVVADEVRDGHGCQFRADLGGPGRIRRPVTPAGHHIGGNVLLYRPVSSGTRQVEARRRKVEL